jgi:DnaJ family protein C protein 7
MEASSRIRERKTRWYQMSVAATGPPSLHPLKEQGSPCTICLFASDAVHLHPPHAESETPPSPRPRPSTDSAEAQRTRSAQSSPEKKSRSSFVRDRDQREKEKKPKSPRASSSFAFRRKSSDESHPLNLPPEELRRLSAFRTAKMASPREEISEPMEGVKESTPAPQQAPGAFPQANGNGDHTEENGPAPPPHKSASNSPPPSSNSPPQSPVVDAQQCKEAGNKFFKAQQYDKAIEEYTKGGYSQARRSHIPTLS